MRKIQAGELEKVKASEEVTRRNVQAVIQHSNETRKALLELREMFDALQGNVMNMQKLQEEQRKQLAALQQQFYARGSVSYSNGEG